MRILAMLLFLPVLLSAQENRVFYYPKPVARVYKPPMKPVTRLADLKAKNKGKTSWREPIIDDGNSVAFMVQEPPGTKHERKLYPDSAAWWAILEGSIRFEIEKADGGFEIINARKGSFVFAPERLLHSLEVIGNESAIRYEVTAGPSSTAVYEKRPVGNAPGRGVHPGYIKHGFQPARRAQPGNVVWQAVALPPERLRSGQAERRQERVHSGSNACEQGARKLHLWVCRGATADRLGQPRTSPHRYR